MTKKLETLKQTYERAYETYVEYKDNPSVERFHDGRLKGIQVCAWDMLDRKEYSEFLKFAVGLEFKTKN